MPLYMDLHRLNGATSQDVVDAHHRDLQVQEKYGVHYLTVWFNEQAGRIFCLVQAPSIEAAVAVHTEAHGLVADEIIEVDTQEVETFLGTAAARADAPEPAPDGGQGTDPGLRSILFTDIVASTATTQRVGDDHAMHLLRVHNVIVRDNLQKHGGREVKHTGDGIMASFVSASRAVECASAIQWGFYNHNAGQPEMEVRICAGISAGEPVEESEDLFGASVQLARRICDQAGPGSTFVSNVVRELCIGKRFAFRDRGEAELKGFAEPVRIFEVDWRAGA